MDHPTDVTPRPNDRSHVPTEARHAISPRIDDHDTQGLLRAMTADARSTTDAVERELTNIVAFIEDLTPRYLDGGRLIYAGAGTSGRLGVLDASECPPTFQIEHGRVVGVIAGGDRALRISSESLEDRPEQARHDMEALDVGARDTVIGITAGGTTPYPLAAIEYAHARGALTTLLTCGLIPENTHADHVINPLTGPEVVAGSTRLNAGTATKLVLNMISTGLMHRTHKIHAGLMVDVSATNDKLRDRAARIIATLTHAPRELCFALLDTAGGRVKTAVVMHAHGCTRSEAEAILLAHGDHLGRAIEAHRD